MKIKFLGHACFEIDYNGKKLLFDPFITGNPLVKAFDLTTLQPDYILLSHSHGDHVADAEAIAKQSGATIISNFEVATWFADKKGLKTHSMNHGGKWNFDFGVVKYVNAVHSSTMLDNSPGGNPGGFVIWGGEHTFYFAGDTALTMDMKLIPMTCPKLDVAILPIGDNYTMGYEDAAIAADFIECDQIIGCHYNTFGYIEIDTDKAVYAFENKGKTLMLPKIGETVEI
jgi:L-ascorbate metabolism protein UlaG (beta-lactamase superfamily)